MADQKSTSVKTLRGLHVKIVGWSVVPIVTILFTFVLVLFMGVQQLTLMATRLAAEQIAQDFGQAQQALVEFAATYPLTLTVEVREQRPLASGVITGTNVPPPERNQALRLPNPALAQFNAGVVLLNAEGRMVDERQAGWLLAEVDWAALPEFAYARDNAALGITDPFLSNLMELGDRKLVGAWLPLLDDNGAFQGALVGLWHLGFDFTVDNPQVGFLDLIVVDERGSVLHHPNPARYGTPLPRNLFLREVLSGKSGVRRLRDFNGQSALVGYAPIPNTSWFLLTTIRWTALLQKLGFFLQGAGLIMLVGIILPLLVVHFGVARIVAPINELILAAREVANGNFGRTIAARTGDEIEVLADQFNLMSQQLAASYAELEQKVAERTHELLLVSEERERRNRELTLLNRVIATAASAQSVEQVLSSICRELGEAFRVPQVGAALLEPDGAHLRVVAEYCVEGRPCAIGSLISVAESRVTRQVLEQGAPLFVPDVRAYPDLDLATDVRALLLLPVPMGARIAGTIGLDCTEARIFSAGEIELAMSVVKAISQTLERLEAEAALRRNEERLTIAMEAANLMLWDLDVCSGELVVADYGAVREDGLCATDLYAAWMATLSPEERARIEEAKRQHIAGLTPRFEVEFRVPEEPGRWAWKLQRGRVTARDADGHPLRVTGILEDITARKQFEEDLQRARDAAEAANRAKSAFLASMSHELRTPLNAILGFTQLMVRDPALAPDQRENLEIINRSGQHLLSLINDVLEMSKIESGRTRLFEQSFDFYRLLEDLENMFSLRADNKGLQLTFERAEDVPRYLRADESKLRQVLINLLGNAVKFTEQGEVRLKVTYRAAPHPRLYFAVHDTGPGISAEELEIIFDPFVQTQSGLRSQEGTGLGLPISREFVRMMGGDIGVDSTPGVGSTFYFDIPITLANAEDVEEVKPRRRVVGLAEGQPTYRMLVVEDKWANRKLLVRLLQPLGFEIREATNGQEALEIWESWRPHVVWMDMRMPVMDGYEATRRIKATAQGQATIVIAITASAFEEDRKLILSEGCDDFIRKPFQEWEIYDRLERHLGVRFIYEEERLSSGPAPEESQRVLRGEALAALPESWRASLREAALQADAEWVLRLADEVPASPVAEALRALVRDFRFDLILEALG